MFSFRFSALRFATPWLLYLLVFLHTSAVVADDDVRWIRYVTDEGTFWFDDLRPPSLYTGTFGNCQGDSRVDLTRFDAALYTDNMTVTLHLQGTTTLQGEQIVMGISVHAYGETRLNMMINPCTIDALPFCKLSSDIPLIANGLVPIDKDNLVNVPDIAYSIPDFEGQAVLRLYSAVNQTQLGCYVAVMTNGNSLSHPGIVGSILGLFTILAFLSSMAVAIYGEFVPETRMHYAHTVSVFVVFSVFHHIFFTGALSVDWPSVLPAFWSNFAWSAGLIHTDGMQKSINTLMNGHFGDISLINGTPNNANYTNLGGMYDADALLQNTRQGVPAKARARDVIGQQLFRRTDGLYDRSTGFNWYGDRVQPGLPLPGNYSGFAGTLSELSIPVSNALLTGIVWMLILFLILIFLLVILKFILSMSMPRTWTRSKRWEVFRKHWVRFIAFVMLRSCHVAFFMISVLALFQFVIHTAVGSIAIAAVIWIGMIVLVFGTSVYALWYRLRSENFQSRPDRLHLVFKKWRLVLERDSTGREREANAKILASIPWVSMRFIDPANRPHVHEDVKFISKLGWLTARFRRSRWWVFMLWVFYEFIRACLLGGAAGNALIQIPLLLIWEIIAFVTVVALKPFESGRLNLIMVYLLGISKIVTTALSLAFLPQFALGRILTTVIGVMIVVVQGLLTICLVVVIALGVASTCISVMRYKDNSSYKSERWIGYRIRYFEHVKKKDADTNAPQAVAPVIDVVEEKEPTFAVSAMRRLPKIEDDVVVQEVCSVSSSHSTERPLSIMSITPRPLSSHFATSPLRAQARMSKTTFEAC